MVKVKTVTAIFFLLEHFVDKATFNFLSFNKNNGNVTTEYVTTKAVFLSTFYSNPYSGPNEKGMGKAQLSWYTKSFNKKHMWHAIFSCIILFDIANI